MKKTLISFVLLLSGAVPAFAGPSNLPTPRDFPELARRNVAPAAPYALTGDRQAKHVERHVRTITIAGGNGGSVAIPFWVNTQD